MDSEKTLYNYLDKHIAQIESNMFLPKYRLMKDTDIGTILEEIELLNQKLPHDTAIMDYCNE